MINRELRNKLLTEKSYVDQALISLRERLIKQLMSRTMDVFSLGLLKEKEAVMTRLSNILNQQILNTELRELKDEEDFE